MCLRFADILPAIEDQGILTWFQQEVRQPRIAIEWCVGWILDGSLDIAVSNQWIYATKRKRIELAEQVEYALDRKRDYISAVLRREAEFDMDHCKHLNDQVNQAIARNMEASFTLCLPGEDPLDLK